MEISSFTQYRATAQHDVADGAGAAARVRVALADEQPLLMDGVARALDGSSGMRVVLQATSGAELLQRLDDVPVDVVLIEPWMRDGDGLDAISALTTRFPELPIIALSGVADPGHVQQAVALGVHAYVGKSTRANDLPSIVRHVIAGAMVMPAVSTDGRSVLDLTPRELEVLRLAAEGLSNSEIGSRLYVTEQTIKFHLGNIYRKMGVSNRTEAAHQALRRGLIS
ncbi:MAG: DNA-binding response regulator [Mycobacteriaceae bacterium]|nr:DNA-binding response regulator [Mycobacteriaceae bacterium]